MAILNTNKMRTYTHSLVSRCHNSAKHGCLTSYSSHQLLSPRSLPSLFISGAALHHSFQSLFSWPVCSYVLPAACFLHPLHRRHLILSPHFPALCSLGCISSKSPLFHPLWWEIQNNHFQRISDHLLFKHMWSFLMYFTLFCTAMEAGFTNWKR